MLPDETDYGDEDYPLPHIELKDHNVVGMPSVAEFHLTERALCELVIMRILHYSTWHDILLYAQIDRLWR